jgi:hypothetical protein
MPLEFRSLPFGFSLVSMAQGFLSSLAGLVGIEQVIGKTIAVLGRSFPECNQLFRFHRVIPFRLITLVRLGLT